MSHAMSFNFFHALAAIEGRTKQGPQIPSKRNQEIFRRVEALRKTQQDVAAELRISPSRVSQIVGQVRRWLAGGSQGDPEQLARLERKRLERTLAAARHQAVLDITLDELHRQKKNPQHTTIRTEEKLRRTACRVGPASNASAGPPSSDNNDNNNTSDDDDANLIKRVTTVRDQPLNVQLLKVAQRSIDQIQRLSDLEPIPEPPSAETSDDELFNTIYKVLIRWRQRAEDEGRVAKSEDSQSLVEYFLAALLGRHHGWGAEGFYPVSPAVRQLVENFVKESCSVADVLPPDVPPASSPTASLNSHPATTNPPTPPLNSPQAPSPTATASTSPSPTTTPTPPTTSTAPPPP